MEMKDNLQKYYEYLKSVNADVPSTFESFQKTLSDEVSAQKYFDYLKENKFDAPDTFESFSTTLGLKKKDISEVTGTPSEVSLPEQPPLPSEKPITPERKTSVVGDLLRSLKSSSLRVTGAILATPQMLNRTLAGSLIRPIVKSMGGTDEEAEFTLNSLTAGTPAGMGILGMAEAQKPLSRIAQRAEEKMAVIEGNIWENLVKGEDGKRDLGAALELFGRGSIASVPYLAIVAATAGGGAVATLGTISATAASQQYAENEGLKENKRILNSWMYGGFEAVGELASAYIFRGIGKSFRQGLVKKLSDQSAKNIAKGIAGAVGLEGSSEAITQIGQNVTDIVTGKNPELGVFSNVFDSFVIGGLGFGLIGGGVRPLASVLGMVMAGDKEVVQVQENFKQQEAIIEQIEQTDSDPVKNALKKSIKDLQFQADEVMDANYELAQKLSPEEQNQVAGLYSVWNELQDKILTRKITEQQVPAIEKTIAGIKDQIQTIKDNLITRLEEEAKAEKEVKIDEIKEKQETELDKLKEKETKELDKVKDVEEGEKVNKKKLDEVKEKYDTKIEEVKTKIEKELTKVEEEANLTEYAKQFDIFDDFKNSLVYQGGKKGTQSRFFAINPNSAAMFAGDGELRILPKNKVGEEQFILESGAQAQELLSDSKDFVAVLPIDEKESAFGIEDRLKEIYNKSKEETKDAETIRREAEEAGRPQELVEGEEERLRLRRAEEDRVEAEQREEVVPQIGDIITAQGKMGTWEITGFKEDGTVIIRPLEHVVDSETRYYIQPNDITETVFKTPPKPKEAVTGEEVADKAQKLIDEKFDTLKGVIINATLTNKELRDYDSSIERKILDSKNINSLRIFEDGAKYYLQYGSWLSDNKQKDIGKPIEISKGKAKEISYIIAKDKLTLISLVQKPVPLKEAEQGEEVKPPTKSEQLKEKEAEIEPVKAEEPRKEVGVKFKNKSYVSVEAVQDDFAEGKLTFKEQNQVLEEVRKFEDGLKVEAKKKSTKAADKLGMLSKDAENNSRKKVDDILQVRLIPPDIVSLGNTALWKQLIKPRDAVANWMAGRLQAGVQSQNDVIRWVTKSVTNLYGGFLRTERDILRKLEMVGTTKEFAPLEASQIQVRLRDIVNSDPESLRRVRDVLDPEIAKEQITYDNLSASEQNLFNLIRDLNTWVHETNYADGFLPTDTYLKFKDADGNVKYIARMYDEYEIPSEITEFIKRGNNATSHKLNVDIFKMRKEIDDWKKEHAIEDPAYLTTKRVMQTIQNHAIKEYMDFVASEHPDFVREVKTGEDVPKGFTKLSPSYRWGDMRNKAIVNHILEDFTGYFYASKLIDATYDALKLWDRTKLNQFYKKWHTVYNLFVQLGNMTGNVFFASISGINPVRFISEIPNAIRDANKGTAEYKSLLRSGIMGATGITGDMTPITSANKNMVENMTASQEILSKAVNILTKADDFAIKLYQGADNVAKFAAYRIFREQGLTHEQAIRRTYDSFQNYATVGKTWDVASKTPYLGNKFIKFQADLQRILLNGITTSPLTTVGTLMLVSLLGTVASKLSGEGEEEKKVREQRKGVAKIPLPFGMSVPLSFKVGKKELNVARYLSPLYLYRYGDSDADLAEISKFFPFQFQKVERPQLGEKGYVPSWSDPTLGWIAQVVSDRDFRGASIRNPQATKYFNPNPTNEEKIANVMNYVARAQLPFYKSTQDILDGITGQLDYYGRKRTWSDAILNNIIRIQEFDKPELKKYIEGNIGYLTNRFAGLSESMGNTNASFLKEINRAKEQGLSKSMQQKLYKTQDEIRTKRLAKSLEAQVPIMEELERLVSVYKKWYSDDPFVQENFLDIEAGRNRRFDVFNDIDLQKKYKDEYLLIKNNGLLTKPEIPNYFQSQKLTEEQKKRYSSIYWSEYVRNLDNFIGLTDEEIAREKEIIVTIIEEMGELPKERTSLQQKALHSAREAKIVADGQLEIILQSEK